MVRLGGLIWKLAIILIVVSQATLAEEASAPKLAEPLPSAVEQTEQKMVECVEKKTPPRVRALATLELEEKKIQDRFESLRLWIEANPGVGGVEFEFRLRELFDETRSSLASHVSASGSDRILNAYRQSEAGRMLAETAIRVAIAAASNRSVAEEFEVKARAFLDDAYQSLKKIPAKERGREIPALLRRLARTDLTIARLDQMKDVQSSGNLNPSMDRLQMRMKKYQEIAAPGDEKGGLSLVLLDSMLGFYEPMLGSQGGEMAILPSHVETMEKLRGEVAALSKTAKNGRLKESARGLDSFSRFFARGRLEQEERVQELQADLSSPDPEKRELAERTWSSLVDRVPGTFLENRLLELPEVSASSYAFRERRRLAERADRERANAYRDGVDLELGKGMAQKLGLATYEELVRSPGAIRREQGEYLKKLGKLGELQKRIEADRKSVSEEEVNSTLIDLDLTWVRLQCQRQSIGLAEPLVQKKKTRGFNANHLEVTAPFSSSRFDVADCVNLRGKRDYIGADKAASGVISQGIDARTHRELAWVAGEFAFDVATTVASVGAATVVKAALKSGMKKAGVALLKNNVAKAAVVKAGVRSTAFSGTVLATDASVQTMAAGREFLEAGLKGDWDPSHFSENFAYTSTAPREHAVRILTTALASRGLDSIWGRSQGFIPEKLASWGNTSSVGKMVGEFSKQSINRQFLTAGTEAAFAATGCQKDASVTPGANLLSWEEWVNSFQGAIIGKVKGDSARGARVFAGTVVERASDFEAEPLSVEAIEQLKKCLVPEEISALREP
jgi:hypothetical protein